MTIRCIRSVAGEVLHTVHTTGVYASVTQGPKEAKQLGHDKGNRGAMIEGLSNQAILLPSQKPSQSSFTSQSLL